MKYISDISESAILFDSQAPVWALSSGKLRNHSVLEKNCHIGYHLVLTLLTVIYIYTWARRWRKSDKVGNLLKLQKSMLSKLIGCWLHYRYSFKAHVTRHLTNDFCWNCRDEEKKETVLHLLDTRRTLCLRRDIWFNGQPDPLHLELPFIQMRKKRYLFVLS